jgi:hypothetical protein
MFDFISGETHFHIVQWTGCGRLQNGSTDALLAFIENATL